MRRKDSKMAPARAVAKLAESLVCTCMLLGSGLAYGQRAIRATTEDGNQVILNPDGTWRHFDAVKTRYEKSPSATQKIKTPFGDFAIWIDPTIWHQTRESAAGRLSFENVNGENYAMVVSERIPIPTESLNDIALSNVRDVDPNAKITLQEKRTVNGRDVLCLQIEASNKNIPFTYYGYYYGGTSGTIQVVTFTVRSAFAKNEPDSTQFLNGLEVYDSEYRLSQTATKENQQSGQPHQITLNSGKFVVIYDSQKWKEAKSSEPGRATLGHVAGDGYAMVIAEAIQVPLDSLPELAVSNAQDSAPGTKITFREKRSVNGVELWCLRLEGTTKEGIAFTYYGYYYGGKAGTIQLITYTGTSLFAEYEKDFTELLNALHIKE